MPCADADPYTTISLLTDLGTDDGTVGILHAIIADAAPHTRVVDLTHGIGLGDVRAASLALARAVPYLPEGVVVVAVDGESARLVAVEVGDGAGVFIGPDNGVLAAAVAMAGGATAAVLLDDVEYHLASPGATLPVRDIAVPCALALCAGVPLATLGSPIDAGTMLPGTIPLPREIVHDDRAEVVADVLWVGRNGWVQLNIGPDDLATVGAAAPGDVVTAGRADAQRVATWVDAAESLMPGAIGLLVDPYGMLALVAQNRSAAEELGVVAGDHVFIAAADSGGQPAASLAVHVRLSSGER